jgi:hypothetical protein
MLEISGHTVVLSQKLLHLQVILGVRHLESLKNLFHLVGSFIVLAEIKGIAVRVVFKVI